MNYLLSKVAVKDIMNKKVLTVTEDSSIEEAARIMADHKIGSLPVMHGDEVVGIITETDLFKIFLELMGTRENGIRITALIREQRGQIARLTQAIASQGGNFVAFGQFAGPSPSYRQITFKVAGLEEAQLKEIIQPLIEKLIDVRTV
jgi:acetoin utilization protein AcuB